jgi:dynein light chain LC8-type
VSAIIKRLCDEKYGPTWQCIVGEDFKASFTHETKHFMFIASGKQNVLVWKSG